MPMLWAMTVLLLVGCADSGVPADEPEQDVPEVEEAPADVIQEAVWSPDNRLTLRIFWLGHTAVLEYVTTEQRRRIAKRAR